MYIPKRLPQFQNERVLLLVTGLRAGKTYLATDGSMELLSEFEEPIPHYSDNEGFFAARGLAPRSGAVREINDEDLAKKFVKKVVKEIRADIKEYQPTALYLFSLRAHEIENALPKRTKALVRHAFIGDYLKTSMQKLLEMIDTERHERLVEPMKSEAAKILAHRKLQLPGGSLGLAH